MIGGVKKHDINVVAESSVVDKAGHVSVLHDELTELLLGKLNV